MNAAQFSKLCRSHGACAEGLAWIEGKSLREFWDTCERADWMLWLLGKQLGAEGWPDRKQLVLLACLCAETALKFVPDGEDRPRKAIETARAWTQKKATLAQVRAAAADAAYAAAAATDAYAYAADAYAAAAATAATAAAAATRTAAAAAAAARRSARYSALRTMAGMIRTALPSPLREPAR